MQQPIKHHNINHVMHQLVCSGRTSLLYCYILILNRKHVNQKQLVQLIIQPGCFFSNHVILYFCLLLKMVLGLSNQPARVFGQPADSLSRLIRPSWMVWVSRLNSDNTAIFYIFSIGYALKNFKIVQQTETNLFGQQSEVGPVFSVSWLLSFH